MSATLTRHFAIQTAHSDVFGHCKAEALQGFMQIAATDHSTALGVSREDKVLGDGVFWVLSRMIYRLEQPVLYKTEIDVTTWHRGAQGPYFVRDFLIEQEGAEIGWGTSQWILYSRESGKILRPEVLGEDMTHPPKVRDVPVEILKLKVPESLAPLPPHHVVYSDLDYNHHVNNVKYTGFIADCIHRDAAPLYLRTLQINFKHEALLGDKVGHELGETPEGWLYLRGTIEGRLCYEALAETAPCQSLY